MDKFDRFQLLHRQFRSHRNPIPITKLAENLECSQRTVQRTIQSMRDYLDAPIEYFATEKGWHYTEKDKDLYELSGLWLTSGELQSLALLLQLLNTFGNGLLNQEMSVIEKHINKMLEARKISRSTFENHIKVIPLNNRYTPNKIFAQVSEALLNQQQLKIQYTDFLHRKTERTISPQTLIYYRENWQLDAWCHLRQELRTFSLARINKITLLKTKAKRIGKKKLKQHYTQGYGIFAGEPKHKVTLRFFPDIAREIALQQWHPEQTARWDGNDYLLSFPYADDRELIQDILSHTPNVYVESPAGLRKKVQDKLCQGLELCLGEGVV